MGYRTVAPFTGAWIEILKGFFEIGWYKVAPFTGAWIEIKNNGQSYETVLSLPSRERGLKYIEKCLNLLINQSLPSRERGLK